MNGWRIRTASWFRRNSAEAVVGIAKVSPVFPGQWWLHGLRVDPEFQGLKIGSHLHEYVNEWWLEHGDGTIRLLTSTKRVQVHHLCERTGYNRVGEIITYRRSLDAGKRRAGGAMRAPGRFTEVDAGRAARSAGLRQEESAVISAA